MQDMSEQIRVKASEIDFASVNPEKELLSLLRAKPEIDYEEHSEMLFKWITQVTDHYREKYGENGLRHIVMMNKKDIAEKIYLQMLKHYKPKNGFLVEEVVSVSHINKRVKYNVGALKRIGLYSQYLGNIKNYLFDGIKKGVFSETKFDSFPELKLARVVERDNDVVNWLRPAPDEFDLTYHHGHHYEPDFVIEMEYKIYLVEVKRDDQVEDELVKAKADRAISYCKIASDWGKANGYKEWSYMLIPSQQISESISFKYLAERFELT